MRVVLRTSKFAIWSRRLGSFALPMIIFAIFMHRAGYLDTQIFRLIMILASILAILAIIFAFTAFIILWFSGDRGWARGVSGLFLGIICLIPLLFSFIEMQKYPLARDVSTNPALNIKMLTNIIDNDNFAQASQTELVAAFPNMIVRYYPINADIAYNLALKLVRQSGWDIIGMQSDLSNKNNRQINAISMSFLGMRDEVAILITQIEQGTEINMRSHSLSTGHDGGRNGKRIEKFLLEFDREVNKFLRENISDNIAPIPHIKEKD